MTRGELLCELTRRGLVLQVVGTRLACGPKARLTDDVREALHAHRDALLPDLHTWGAETGMRVLWLRHAAPLRFETFHLDAARRVVDPALFYARLYLDVQAGPAGARSRTGALSEDLHWLAFSAIKDRCMLEHA